MKDCREDLTRNIDYILSQADINEQTIRVLKNKLISELSKYEVYERSTEIATVDSASEQMIALYLGTIKVEGKSKKTIACYGRLLVQFMRSINKPLMDVTTFDIRAWLIEKQQTISLRSCENYRSYLSAFYMWANAEGFIATNPMIKIKPVKYEDVVRKAFSDVEIDSMRSACTTLRQRAELEVFLSSGARLSELCAMNISDVDLRTKAVLIRDGKGGKQRTTYISDVAAFHLRKYLESRKDSNESMFISKNYKRVNKSTIWLEISKVGKAAAVANVHPHRFRRTFATSLSNKGMDISSIQRLMGHSNINTTMSYIAIDEAHIRNEYQKYS